jgi:hypothetical protein
MELYSDDKDEYYVSLLFNGEKIIIENIEKIDFEEKSLYKYHDFKNFIQPLLFSNDDFENFLSNKKF